ncbi:EmrB/QacA subfamily drug resistance transporter [Allocatelliglobosispora scoriae]|uniref:EmrB/QacA subfamily drug resistance transporter n=1 Tax=Allocatelliglobosispora scoriae TaxID=643052 RepID=A0A841BY07_9ACTN|nr:DHA2 family efflux MFS transporter permease subunit [Allocatelliglobosispora scoriae]MBB5873044.1 EmrB/QacA subfamily drug resistance transporter [Allocatelliglobosispora scoriae]
MDTQAPPNTGHPRRWAILAVLVLSLLVVVLDNTVLNVAMRTLASPEPVGIGATQGQLEWAINSYTLVFAGLLFSFGILGDRWGRKRMLILGLVLFGLASLVSAYAQDPGQLIAARALMGIGGAAIMPVTLSIISNVFDPRERAKAIGLWTGAVGLAIAIGPLLGGFLLEHFWWGSVFLINVPIVLIGLVSVALLVPESRNPNPGKLDLVGVVLSVIGLTALVYGIVDGGEHGFDQPEVWAWVLGGAAVIAAFIRWEMRTDHPSLDVKLFRDARFSASIAGIGLLFFGAMGSFFFTGFYLQMVRDFSPIKAGALFVPFALGQMFFAPLSSTLVRRYGVKLVSTLGMLLATATFVVITTWNAETPVWAIAVNFFFMGVGMANVMPPATAAIMSTLPREKAGVGSAVSNTVRQVSAALGVAVLGSIVAGVYRDQVAGATAALPDGVRETASESIGGAYGVAQGLAAQGQGAVAAPLMSAANDAFVQAMHWAAWGSAAITLVGAFVILKWAPGKLPAAPPAPATGAPAAPEAGSGAREKAPALAEA